MNGYAQDRLHAVESKHERPGLLRKFTLRLRACALCSVRTAFSGGVLPISLLALFRVPRAAVLGVTLAVLAGVAFESAAQTPLDAEVSAFVDEMVEKHEFRRAELMRLFAKV